MAFIQMSLVDDTFQIRFGRKESNAYTLKIGIADAQVNEHCVLVFSKGGLVSECLTEQEHNYPLFIGCIEKPMGDTLTLNEICGFYNDIVFNTREEFPTIELILGEISGGTSSHDQHLGQLVHRPNPDKDSWMVFAEMKGDIDFRDALSCTRSVRIFGIDPMVGSNVNHQFFALQFVSALTAIAQRTTPTDLQETYLDQLDESFSN